MAFIARRNSHFRFLMGTCVRKHNCLLSVSQYSNSNLLLYQPNFSVSSAGYRRLTVVSTENRSKKRSVSLYERMLNYLDECGQLEKLALLYESTIVIFEREHGLRPMLEPKLSIRRKTLELESLIAPELEDPRKVLEDLSEFPFSYKYHWKYTEAKWLLILQKSDHPRVKQLIELMEEAEVHPLIFRQTLGHFALAPFEDIERYARPLELFAPEEVEYACRSHLYSKNNELEAAIRSITRVLMKA